MSEEKTDTVDDLKKNKVLDPKEFQSLSRKPEEGDFVVVEFLGKRRSSPTYKVGKITKNFNIDGNGEISYLKRSEKILNKFLLPSKSELHAINIKNIITILPNPTFSGQQALYHFDVNLTLLRLNYKLGMNFKSENFVTKESLSSFNFFL